jgi:hypothetical protein
MGHTYNPSYMAEVRRKIMVCSWWGKKQKTLSKTKAKKGWGCG